MNTQGLSQQAGRSLWLYRFSLVLVGAVLFLILAGGLVTSHDAGLAVPDWPTSYGQLFPPMVGNVFWEHGHRMIAGTVAILTFILAVWIQIKETRREVKRLAWVAFSTVILQALLGGLTVLLMLPPAVSIAHACLAQAFFCLAIALAYFLKPSEVKRAETFQEQGGRSLKRLAILTSSFIYIQLILGAAIRHTSFTVIPHIVVAFLVLLHVILLVVRIGRFYHGETGLTRASLALGLVTITQIFLGMGAFIFTRLIESGYAPSTGSVVFTAVHQTTGAVVLGLSVLISIISVRQT